MAAMNVAPVKWAQRSATLYITISLSDLKDTTIDLSETGLSFTGKTGDKSYALNLEFFGEVEKEGSVWNVLPQSIQMKLNKKDKEAEFWPRLLKDKTKEKTNVTIDWDRYVDEVRTFASACFGWSQGPPIFLSPQNFLIYAAFPSRFLTFCS